MRILITGAGGQLAYDLQRVLEGHGGHSGRDDSGGSHETIPLVRADLDVCDSAAVWRALETHWPDVVINTAAFLRVDDCECQPEAALRVNALAVRALAAACRHVDAALVHVSTDYVFGGQPEREPLGESATPAPTCVYGVSKLAGEHLIRCTWSKHYIVRPCGLYGIAGSSGKGGNFVQTMLRKARAGEPIAVVDDQTCTPTYTLDLAQKIAWLITTGACYGLYHITNAGWCTWYEFARTIFALAGIRARLTPTTSTAFNAPARRPAYSVLRPDALRALGADDLRPWPDALRAYLVETAVIPE